jgi:hypothetical protein
VGVPGQARPRLLFVGWRSLFVVSRYLLIRVTSADGIWYIGKLLYRTGRCVECGMSFSCSSNVHSVLPSHAKHILGVVHELAGSLISAFMHTASIHGPDI